jgi:hypothetical protein
MNSGLGFRGFLGFRVLGFFFFLAYAIIPSSLLNIGFTAKGFPWISKPMQTPSCIKSTESETEKKISLLQQNLSGLHEREREREREREKEISVLCGCGF